MALTRANLPFRDHYYQDLRRRMDSLVAVQQQREAASFLLTRIGDGKLHRPVFATPETTIREAVALMQANDSTAVLVRRGNATGIFTERDVRERSVLLGLPDSQPIGDLAVYNLLTLDRDDLLFNALILMAKHSIRHIVITKGNEIVGVFEQLDLLSHLCDSSFVISNQVERAAATEDLTEPGHAILRVIQSLFDRGIKPRYISRIVTDLNRKLFRRLFEQLVSEPLLSQSCLIVMGSEGRGEQLMRTDQDNGLIFDSEPDRRQVQAFADRFTAILADLGYPPCPGNVMVSNPEWAKTIDTYKSELRQWIGAPDGDAFLKLAILYDASAVAGDSTLLDELKAFLLRLISQEQAFLGHFAKPILGFATPLTWFNRIKTKTGEHAGKLDIKKGGLFPIVHGVRSLALEHSLSETNTVARIQALSGLGPFGVSFSANVIEAFDFMSMLRLRAQLAGSQDESGSSDYVDVKQLTNFEKNLLRDSLRIVRELKSYISNHYRLQMLG
jgi:CBS domain-containing protein